MRLMYRGNSYEVGVPIPKFPAYVQYNSNSANQPKAKLIYRGLTFDYVPPPVKIPEVDSTDWVTVTLIYRGNVYMRKIQPLQPYQVKSFLPSTGVGSEQDAIAEHR
jgi:Domain of unknown function (DUF4278)